jgi:hypothetical protein
MLLLVVLVLMLLLAVSLLAVARVHVLCVVGASSSGRIVDAGRSCVVGAAPHEEEEGGVIHVAKQVERRVPAPFVRSVRQLLLMISIPLVAALKWWPRMVLVLAAV